MSLTRLARHLPLMRTDARPPAAARLMIGIAALFMAVEARRVLSRLVMPSIVRMPLIPGLPTLPAGALDFFLAVWIASALAFAIGWKTRTAGVTLTLVTACTLVMDAQTYSNHLYLLVLATFLLTIARSGAAWSMDARRNGGQRLIAAWPIALFRLQISIVYVFAALARITPGYLAGDILVRSLKQDGLLALPLSWRTPTVMAVLAATAIAVELFIACALWSPRLRVPAIGIGVGFHFLILTTIESSRLSLGIFALAMFAGYLLFVSEDQWGRWSRRMLAVRAATTPARADAGQ